MGKAYCITCVHILSTSVELYIVCAYITQLYIVCIISKVYLVQVHGTILVKITGRKALFCPLHENEDIELVIFKASSG